MAQLHYVRPRKVSTDQVARTMLVMVCGLATSLLTAFALAFTELRSGIAAYSYSLWVIFPIGAMAAGALAASGYWAGSRFLAIRPGRLMLVGVLFVSTMSWFAIQWLIWLMLEVDGLRARDIIPFLQFVQLSIESTSLSIENVDTGALGKLGYPYVLLQIIGFSAGGWAVYWYLQNTPWCEDCGVYMKEQPTLYRMPKDGEPFQPHIDKIYELLSAEKYREAVAEHIHFGQPAVHNQPLQSTMRLSLCPKCNGSILHYALQSKRENGSFQTIPKTDVIVWSDANLQAVVDEANFLAAASKAA